MQELILRRWVLLPIMVVTLWLCSALSEPPAGTCSNTPLDARERPSFCDTDRDLDGLPNDQEDQLARDFFLPIFMDRGDGCGPPPLIGVFGWWCLGGFPTDGEHLKIFAGYDVVNFVRGRSKPATRGRIKTGHS